MLAGNEILKARLIKIFPVPHFKYIQVVGFKCYISIYEVFYSPVHAYIIHIFCASIVKFYEQHLASPLIGTFPKNPIGV